MLCLVVVKLKNLSNEVRSRLTVHTVQLLPQRGFRENEVCTILGLEPEEEGEVIIPTTVGFLMPFSPLPFHNTFFDLFIYLRYSRTA